MRIIFTFLLSFILTACGGADEEKPARFSLAWAWGSRPLPDLPVPSENNPRFWVYATTQATEECGAWSTKQRRCIMLTWENDPDRVRKALSPAFFCDLSREEFDVCLETFSHATLRI